VGLEAGTLRRIAGDEVYLTITESAVIINVTILKCLLHNAVIVIKKVQ